MLDVTVCFLVFDGVNHAFIFKWLCPLLLNHEKEIDLCLWEALGNFVYFIPATLVCALSALSCGLH